MSSEIDFLFSREEDAKYVNDFVDPLTNAVSTILTGHVDGEEQKRVVCKIFLGPMYTGNHKSIHNYFKTNWVDTLGSVTAVGGENDSIIVSKDVTAFATDGSSICGPHIPSNTRILNSTYSDPTTTINLNNNLTGVVSAVEDAYKITKPVPKTLLEHLNRENECPGRFLFLGINNLNSIFSHLGKHNIRKRVRRIKAKAVVVCTITRITTTENQVLFNRWDQEFGITYQIGQTPIPDKTVVLTLKDPYDEFLNEKKCTFTILYPTITPPWTGQFTDGNKIRITGVNKKKRKLLEQIASDYANKTGNRDGRDGEYMLTVHIGQFTNLANIRTT